MCLKEHIGENMKDMAKKTEELQVNSTVQQVLKLNESTSTVHHSIRCRQV